jgi:hypothetical protein
MLYAFLTLEQKSGAREKYGVLFNPTKQSDFVSVVRLVGTQQSPSRRQQMNRRSVSLTPFSFLFVHKGDWYYQAWKTLSAYQSLAAVIDSIELGRVLAFEGRSTS